jgi:hypothetical protein
MYPGARYGFSSSADRRSKKRVPANLLLVKNALYAPLSLDSKCLGAGIED